MKNVLIVLSAILMLSIFSGCKQEVKPVPSGGGDVPIGVEINDPQSFETLREYIELALGEKGEGLIVDAAAENFELISINDDPMNFAISGDHTVNIYANSDWQARGDEDLSPFYLLITDGEVETLYGPFWGILTKMIN